MSPAASLSRLSGAGKRARQRWPLWVVLFALLVSGCGTEVPGPIQNRVRTLVEEIRPGTELDFTGRTCDSPVGEVTRPYLWSAEGRIEGNPARLIETAREAGVRSGWQPYELRSRRSFEGEVPQQGIILLSQSPGGDEAKFDRTQAAMTLLVKPSEPGVGIDPVTSGVSLTAVSNTSCDEPVSIDPLAIEQDPTSVSVSLLPAWTDHQRSALFDRGECRSPSSRSSGSLAVPLQPHTRHARPPPRSELDRLTTA